MGGEPAASASRMERRTGALQAHMGGGEAVSFSCGSRDEIRVCETCQGFVRRCKRCRGYHLVYEGRGGEYSMPPWVSESWLKEHGCARRDLGDVPIPFVWMPDASCVDDDAVLGRKGQLRLAAAPVIRPLRGQDRCRGWWRHSRGRLGDIRRPGVTRSPLWGHGRDRWPRLRVVGAGPDHCHQQSRERQKHPKAPVHWPMTAPSPECCKLYHTI